MLLAHPVAVAGKGVVELVANADGYLAVAFAPSRSLGDLGERTFAPARSIELARVHDVGGVKDRLDLFHEVDRLGGEQSFRSFASEPSAVFAPQNSASRGNELDHLVGDRSDQGFVGGIGQVEGRANVNAADIGVPIHGIGQPMTIEKLAERIDELGHLLNGHSAVFDHRNRLCLRDATRRFHLGDEAYGIGPHSPCGRTQVVLDGGDSRGAPDVSDGVVECSGIDFRSAIELEEQQRVCVAVRGQSQGVPCLGLASRGDGSFVEALDRTRLQGT